MRGNAARSAPLVPRYRIPAAMVRSEIVVKESVFIGTVTHASKERDAQEFIESTAAEYADASHNAWAYRISDKPQVFGSSDDGEPGGTAGRPMLAVLEGNGLLEVVAVVTRYFGGTKLGTGGLVRAYSNAVREALNALPTRELVLHELSRLRIDYGLYNDLRHLLPRYGVTIREEMFTEEVTMEIAVPYDRAEELAKFLRDATAGRLILQDTWVGRAYL